jgi:hypothetical protein
MIAMAWVRRAALGAMAALAVQGPALSPHEIRLVRYWLVCIDCGGTLDSLGAIGARKPVGAVDSLNHALTAGPGVLRLVRVDSVLALAYVRDSSYRVRNQQPPLALTRVDYVAAGHGRFTNGYRARGAIGLGKIHDVRAIAALDAALMMQLPASVERAVFYARDSMP